MTEFEMVKLSYPVYLTTALLLCAYIWLPNIIRRQAEVDIVRYILLWTDPKSAPLRFLRQGFDAFTSNNCEYTNCYVSHNISDLRDVTHFDVIVFNGWLLPATKQTMQHWPRPRRRTPQQKYVYANTESPQRSPICDTHFDGFFNWTWTYKLESDLRWGFITVSDLTGQVVGPKKDMQWQEMEAVIDSQLKDSLSSKSVAAAWFVSHCRTRSMREVFVKDLVKELHRYGLILHIYGLCGTHICPRGSPECEKLLEKKYHFYLAFENSIYEDYVTEKVLTALNHDTVPVVFGGANYSRFLPPGSFLDARELGAARLAARMAAIIEDHQAGNGSQYQDFFRWRNHYKLKLTTGKEDVCNICKTLNGPAVLKTTVYDNFQEWWIGKGMKCTWLKY